MLLVQERIPCSRTKLKPKVESQLKGGRSWEGTMAGCAGPGRAGEPGRGPTGRVARRPTAPAAGVPGAPQECPFRILPTGSTGTGTATRVCRAVSTGRRAVGAGSGLGPARRAGPSPAPARSGVFARPRAGALAWNRRRRASRTLLKTSCHVPVRFPSC